MSTVTKSDKSKAEIEKLLKILEQDTDETLKYQDDVLNFIEAFKFKRGRFPVRFSLIKDLYNKWSHEPETNLVLRTRMNTYFDNDKLHIFVNRTALSISKELLEEKASNNKIKVKKQKRIHDFIRENHLERGKHYIEGRTLFELFNLWCERREMSKQPIKYSHFMKTMKLFFTFVKTTKQKEYLGINKNIRETQNMSNEKESIEKEDNEEKSK